MPQRSRLPAGANAPRNTRRSPLPRLFRPQRRAAALIIAEDKLLEHAHEGVAFACLERRQDQPLGRGHGGLDLAQQAAAERRDVKRFGAPVERSVLPLDELLLLQPGDHVANGGAVERDDIAQSRLIDARMIVDGEDGRILHRRDVEFPRLVDENGERDLLQPADEMARPLVNAVKSTVGTASFRHVMPQPAASLQPLGTISARQKRHKTVCTLTIIFSMLTDVPASRCGPAGRKPGLARPRRARI